MIALTALIIYLAAMAILIATAKAGRPETVRQYAHRLTLARWHSEAEWRALDAVIRPESDWNPCSAYPRVHDCAYAGSSSCGVPQANPCPVEWRGRLWETRFAQVEWLIRYVAGRYGSPSAALAWREAHGYY